MSKVVHCECGKHYNRKFNTFCPYCRSGVLKGMGGVAAPEDIERLKQRFAR